jgi:F420-non-reducing hydrogenase iron-sulfur subunit
MGKDSKIVLFVCDWAVNPERVTEVLAGLPADIRLAKVKCTGRVDPVFYVDSFLNGADGVLVVGCKEGDCHFLEGNLQAENKIKMVGKLLSLVGFKPGRVRAEWMSTIVEGRFEESVKGFIEYIKTIGDNPLSTGEPDPLLLERMLAAKATVEGFRDRALTSKEFELTERVNVYGEIVPKFKFEEAQDEMLRVEFYRNWMYLLLRRGASSVQGLSERIGLREDQVLRHIVAMRQRNLVDVDRIDDVTPYYKALEALR